MKRIPLYLQIAVFLLMNACSSCGLDNKKVASLSTGYQPPIPFAIDEKEKKNYHDQLQHYFDSTLLGPNSNFNGGILVAKEGQILYEYYQGLEDLSDSSRPITLSSSLHIASTTKPFTAIAILGLVEQGKLSLSDTITRYFPTLPYPSITIRDLLSHRSGLPNYLSFMQEPLWDRRQMATNQDVLQVMITKQPVRLAPPNKRFEYSNTNYLLLALLIEKITGFSYATYLQNAIFKRLGMSHTYVYQSQPKTRFIFSFRPNGVLWPLDHLDLTFGDKNIYSTPRDMLKWDQALYTDQLIDTALLQQAFQGYSFERPGTHHYGLGFRLELLPNGKKVIYHFGRWHGNNAVFARLIEEKVVIIILVNRFNRSIYSAAHNCYDLFGHYYIQAKRGED